MKLFGVFLLFCTICELLVAQPSKVLSCGRRQGIEKNQWPWLVAFFKFPDETFLCEGSLITAQHVLSGAHCFHRKGAQAEFVTPEYLQVSVGRLNLSDHDEIGSTTASVWEIVLHPDWKVESDNFDADIAISVLTEPVVFSDRVIPICLPASANLYPDGLGTVTGWGKNSFEVDREDTPSELETVVVNASYCYTKFLELAKQSSHRAFCAGYKSEQQVQQGDQNCTDDDDSGAGFFLEDPKDSFWSINGIASGVVASLAVEKYCEVNVFRIYTNVGFFRDWIEQETGKIEAIEWEVVEVQCERRGFDDLDYNCTHSFETNSTQNVKVHLNFPADVNTNNIEKIKIHYLSLKRVPPGIGESVLNLKSFYSRDGNIEFIDRSTFRHMKNLNDLLLEDHKLTFLPQDVFWDLKDLVYLDLSSNRIENLPKNIFSRSLILEEVLFAHNKLTHLDADLFKNNLHLVKVWFPGNKLKTIAVDFTTLPKIKGINLTRNVCVNNFIGDFGSGVKLESVLELQAAISSYCSEK